MLYVVAWPLLAEADDTALRRLRAQYHPREAELIGPHFTLVFGAAVDQEASAARRARRAGERRPFWFLIDRHRHDMTPPSRAAYLYAEPADGAAELTELYDALNPAPGDEPFEPHITLGLFAARSKPSRWRASSSASTCRSMAGSRNWRCCGATATRLRHSLSDRLRDLGAD